MTHKLARTNPGQLQHHQALADDRTDAERSIAQAFAAEWGELNDRLTVEQSYECQDEMEQYDTPAEKLMVVRNWRGRLATAASWDRRVELLAEVARAQASIDALDERIRNLDIHNNFVTFFNLEVWTYDRDRAQAELAALES